MTGCRYNAKNSLDKNYLYLAEKNGVEIKAEQEVIDVRELVTDGKKHYEITYRDATKFFKRKRKTRNKGVIDKDNKVFGYDNMYVCDGSVISANPGVNPSLTITALSERARSKIKDKKN